MNNLDRRKLAKKNSALIFISVKPCKWGHLPERYTYNGGCTTCNDILATGKMVGGSFDSLMSSWIPKTDNPDTKWLPLFSGTNTLGYKIIGRTLVDTGVYEEVSRWLWFKANGYSKCSLSKDNLARGCMEQLLSRGGDVNCKYIHLHRFVIGGGIMTENSVCDHINQNRLDNRLGNLRSCSTKNNSWNAKSYCKSTSKYRGVSFFTTAVWRNKRWRGGVQRDGKFQSKCFYTELEAAMWYDKILRDKYPSEFNYYNFPDDLVE